MSWVPVSVNAKEHKEERNVSNVWIFVPKAGQSADFEKGLKNI